MTLYVGFESWKQTRFFPTGTEIVQDSKMLLTAQTGILQEFRQHTEQMVATVSL